MDKNTLKKLAIHHHKRPISFNGKKWLYETTLKNVEVMAIAGGWAMVRLPKCAPYVCEEKELRNLEEFKHETNKVV